MQAAPRQCLHRLLQLQQREFLGHQLKHHGPIFDLGAQTGHAGSQNAAVIITHGGTGQQFGRACLIILAPGFGHHTCLKQQLVALQNQLLVPFVLIQAKSH